MTSHDVLAACGIYAGTFAVAAISSVLPFVAIDVFVIGIAHVASIAALPWIVALAAAGQLAGKLPIYYATRGLATISGSRLERLRRWIDRWRHAPRAVLFASALFGLPPFSLMATAAGVLGVGPRTFSVIVAAGRAIRFAAIVAIVKLTW